MRLRTCLFAAIVFFFGSLPILAGEPGAAGSGWEEQVTGLIRTAEYQFSISADGAWTAPNRAHGFRTRIEGGAIELASRLAGPEEARGGWRLRLVLESFGRPGSERAVPDAPAAVIQGRIERTRDAITDWYINDERGLEQGFTISAPPPGPDSDSILVLSLRIEGGLRARLASDGRSVLFATGKGIDVVRYSGLRVTDARGTELGASLVLVPGALEIRILDGGALYPITVDPLMTSPAWIGESNQAGAQFGAVVAPAGDVNGDGFSDLLIGAPLYDNGQTDEGRVFLFPGSASGPSAAPSWTAESDQAGAQFGASAAPAGDLNGDGFGDVVVGAPLYANGQTDEGRIYVYLGSASGLASSPALVAESNQASAHFGSSVSTAGDVNGDGFDDLVVGAPLFDNGQTDEGRAFLFRGSAVPLATAPAWTAESNQANAQFGFSVAGAGDVNGDRYADLVIGSPLYDNGQTNEGRAWVYLGSGSGPGASAAWTAESDQGSAEFGCSVGAAGDVNGDGYADLIVGAHLFDNGETDEGRAFVYLGSASGPAAAPSWTAESNQAAADFGLSVATAGDINGDGYGDVVVGAPLYKNGQRDEGLALPVPGLGGGPRRDGSLDRGKR